MYEINRDVYNYVVSLSTKIPDYYKIGILQPVGVQQGCHILAFLMHNNIPSNLVNDWYCFNFVLADTFSDYNVIQELDVQLVSPVYLISRNGIKQPSPVEAEIQKHFYTPFECDTNYPLQDGEVEQCTDGQIEVSLNGSATRQRNVPPSGENSKTIVINKGDEVQFSLAVTNSDGTGVLVRPKQNIIAMEYFDEKENFGQYFYTMKLKDHIKKYTIEASIENCQGKKEDSLTFVIAENADSQDDTIRIGCYPESQPPFAFVDIVDDTVSIPSDENLFSYELSKCENADFDQIWTTPTDDQNSLSGVQYPVENAYLLNGSPLEPGVQFVALNSQTVCDLIGTWTLTATYTPNGGTPRQLSKTFSFIENLFVPIGLVCNYTKLGNKLWAYDLYEYWLDPNYRQYPLMGTLPPSIPYASSSGLPQSYFDDIDLMNYTTFDASPIVDTQNRRLTIQKWKQQISGLVHLLPDEVQEAYPINLHLKNIFFDCAPESVYKDDGRYIAQGYFEPILHNFSGHFNEITNVYGYSGNHQDIESYIETHNEDKIFQIFDNKDVYNINYAATLNLFNTKTIEFNVKKLTAGERYYLLIEFGKEPCRIGYNLIALEMTDVKWIEAKTVPADSLTFPNRVTVRSSNLPTDITPDYTTFLTSDIQGDVTPIVPSGEVITDQDTPFTVDGLHTVNVLANHNTEDAFVVGSFEQPVKRGKLTLNNCLSSLPLLEQFENQYNECAATYDQYRIDRGLPAFTWNKNLAHAAYKHAKCMKEQSKVGSWPDGAHIETPDMEFFYAEKWAERMELSKFMFLVGSRRGEGVATGNTICDGIHWFFMEWQNAGGGEENFGHFSAWIKPMIYERLYYKHIGCAIYEDLVVCTYGVLNENKATDPPVLPEDTITLPTEITSPGNDENGVPIYNICQSFDSPFLDLPVSENVEWHSDIQGVLGTALDLNPSNGTTILQPGTHTITATYRKNNNVYTASTDITICGIELLYPTQEFYTPSYLSDQYNSCIGTIQGYRAAAGLPNMVYNEKLEYAAMLHARYLYYNRENPNLDLNSEDLSLPYSTEPTYRYRAQFFAGYKSFSHGGFTIEANTICEAIALLDTGENYAGTFASVYLEDLGIGWYPGFVVFHLGRLNTQTEIPMPEVFEIPNTTSSGQPDLSYTLYNILLHNIGTDEIVSGEWTSDLQPDTWNTTTLTSDDTTKLIPGNHNLTVTTTTDCGEMSITVPVNIEETYEINVNADTTPPLYTLGFALLSTYNGVNTGSLFTITSDLDGVVLSNVSEISASDFTTVGTHVISATTTYQGKDYVWNGSFEVVVPFTIQAIQSTVEPLYPLDINTISIYDGTDFGLTFVITSDLDGLIHTSSNQLDKIDLTTIGTHNITAVTNYQGVDYTWTGTYERSIPYYVQEIEVQSYPFFKIRYEILKISDDTFVNYILEFNSDIDGAFSAVNNEFKYTMLSVGTHTITGSRLVHGDLYSFSKIYIVPPIPTYRVSYNIQHCDTLLYLNYNSTTDKYYLGSNIESFKLETPSDPYGESSLSTVLLPNHTSSLSDVCVITHIDNSGVINASASRALYPSSGYTFKLQRFFPYELVFNGHVKYAFRQSNYGNYLSSDINDEFFIGDLNQQTSDKQFILIPV